MSIPRNSVQKWKQLYVYVGLLQAAVNDVLKQQKNQLIKPALLFGSATHLKTQEINYIGPLYLDFGEYTLVDVF